VRYLVRFEYRSPGAIGKFQIHEGTFTADAPEKAKDMVFDQLHERGFETRGFAVYEDERCVLGALHREVCDILNQRTNLGD
jgi:hypothetical protein